MEQTVRFAAKSISSATNHHEWYISIKPKKSNALYSAGAIESPKSLPISLMFFSGAVFCSMIVPIIEVMAIRAKITTASFIDEKRFHILSVSV